MDTISLPLLPLLRPHLLMQGFSDEMIAAAQRRSEWQPVRPGASLGTEEWQTLDQDDRHRLLVLATVPRLGPNSVISHTSAARLHGLPVWHPGAEPDVVHLYRNRADGGYRKGWVKAHVGVIEPYLVTSISGVPVTSAARTVIDCAAELAHGPAVAMADAALHRGLTSRAELAELVAAFTGRKGSSRSRAVVSAVDGRSESVGESLSRIAMAGCGLPSPSLQYEVTRDDGRSVARTDFAWEQFRTVGEFDGRIKYGRLLKPGESAGEAVWREKLREDAIRELGWEVVRWTWADLAHPAGLVDRILRAFARATRFVAA